MTGLGRRTAAACPGLAARETLYTPAPVVELDPTANRDGRVLALVRQQGHPLGTVSAHGVLGDTDGLYRAPADAAPRQPTPPAPDQAALPGPGPAARVRGPADRPDVGVAAHNRPAMLRARRDLPLRAEHASFATVVVDHTPGNDGALDPARRHHPSRARNVRETMVGLARAHPCGLSVARRRICAFTDGNTPAGRGRITAPERAIGSGPRAGSGAGRAAVGRATGLIRPTEPETAARS
ncbi:hypothetical protein AB0D04_39595 [Streptomyces sp. NPDC048483]|uniref:hypothetical protein n=1 Tax=Streptomyces sp. NPDC048483 TaxID=3154927 RepID=UPI00342B258E